MDTTMATKFEYRHPVLLRALIIGAAFLTYLFDRDDIVWRFVKGSPAHRELERALFFVATLFVGAGAGICTWARARFAREAEADPESQGVRGLIAISVTRSMPVIFYSQSGWARLRRFRGSSFSSQAKQSASFV